MTDYAERAKLIAALINQATSTPIEDNYDAIDRADFISNFVRDTRTLDPTEERNKRLGFDPSTVPFLAQQRPPTAAIYDPNYSKRNLMQQQGLTESGLASLGRGVGVGLAETANIATNIVDLVAGTELTEAMDYKIEEFFGAHGGLDKAPISKAPYFIGKMLGMLPGLVAGSRAAGATIGSINAVRKLGFTNPTVARAIMAAAEGSYQEMLMENPDPKSMIGFAALDWGLRWRRAGVAMSEALHTKRAKTMGGLTKYFDTKEIRWFREAELQPGALPDGFWWDLGKALRKSTEGTNTADILKTIARPLIARHVGDSLGNVEFVVNNSRSAKSVFVVTGKGQTLNIANDGDLLKLMDLMYEGDDYIARMIGPEALINELRRTMTAQTPEEIETLFKIGASGVEHEVQAGAVQGAKREIGVVLEDVKTGTEMFVTQSRLASDPKYRRGIYDGQFLVRRVMHISSDVAEQERQLDDMLKTVFGRRYGSDMPGVYVESGVGANEAIVRFRIPNPVGDGYIIEEVSVPMTRTSYRTPSGEVKTSEDILGFAGQVHHTGGGPNAWIDGATKLSALRAAGAEVFEVRVPNLADIRTRRVLAAQLTGANLAPQRGRSWWRRNVQPPTTATTTNTVSSAFGGPGTPVDFGGPGTPVDFGGPGTPVPFGPGTPGRPPVTPPPSPVGGASPPGGAPRFVDSDRPGVGGVESPVKAAQEERAEGLRRRDTRVKGTKLKGRVQGPPSTATTPPTGTTGATRVVEDIDMERRWMEERSAQLAEDARKLNEELSRMPDLTTPEARAKLDELERIINAKDEFDAEIYRRLNQEPTPSGLPRERPDWTGKALPATTGSPARAATTGAEEVPTATGPAVPLPPGEPIKALPAGKAPGPRTTATLLQHEARLGMLLDEVNKQKLALQAAIRRGDVAWIRKTFGPDMSPGDLMSMLDRRIASIQKELSDIRVGLVDVTQEMQGGLSLVKKIEEAIKGFFARTLKNSPKAQNFYGIPGVVENHPIWGVLRSTHMDAAASEGKKLTGSAVPNSIDIEPGTTPIVRISYTGPKREDGSFDVVDIYLIQRGSEIHELDDVLFTGPSITGTQADELGWQMVTKKHTLMSREKLAKMPESQRDLINQRLKNFVEMLYNRGWSVKQFPGERDSWNLYLTTGHMAIDEAGRVWINPTILQKVPTAKNTLPEFLAKYLGRRSKGVDPWIATFLARADRARMGQWVRGENQAPMSAFEAKLRAAVASDMENGLSSHDASSAVVELQQQDPKLFAELMRTHTDRTPEIAHLEWIEERAKALLRTGQAQEYHEAIEKAVRQLGYDMDVDTQKQLFSEAWHPSTIPGATSETDPIRLLGAWQERSSNIWETILEQADTWLIKRDELTRLIQKARTLAPLTPTEQTILKEHILPMLNQWLARSRTTEDLLEYMDVLKEREKYFNLLKSEVDRGTLGLDDYISLSEFFATIPRDVMENAGTTFEWVRTNMRTAMELPTAVEAQPYLLSHIRQGAFVPTQMELVKGAGWVNVRRLELHSDGTVSGEFLAMPGTKVAGNADKVSKWMPFTRVRLEQTRMAGWSVPSFSGAVTVQKSAVGMGNMVVRLLRAAGLTGVFHEYGHIGESLIPPAKMQYIAEQMGNWMVIQAARALKSGQKLPEMSKQLQDLALAISKNDNVSMPISMIVNPTELLAEFLGRRMADVTKYVRSTTMDVPIQTSRTRHSINKVTMMANRDAELRFGSYEVEEGSFETSSDVFYTDTIAREEGEIPIMRAMDSEVPQREARVVGPYDETDPRLDGALDDDLARGSGTTTSVRTEPAGGPPRASAALEEGYPKIVEQRGLARSWRVGRRKDPLFVEGATPDQIAAAESLYVYLKHVNNAMWGTARPEDKALFASIDALLDDMFDPISKSAMRGSESVRMGLDPSHEEFERLTYNHIQNFWGVAPEVLTRNIEAAVSDAQNTRLAYVTLRDWERYRRSLVQLDRYSTARYQAAKPGTKYIYGIMREDGTLGRYWVDDFDEAWRVRSDLVKKGDNAQIVVQTVDEKALAQYEVDGAATGFNTVPRAVTGPVTVKDVPMYYQMPNSGLRPGLRSQYPNGTSTASLIESGLRTATTRNAFAKVGDVVTFKGVSGKFRIVSVEKPDLATEAGRARWEALEGWSLEHIDADPKLKKQVYNSVQTVFERIPDTPPSGPRAYRSPTRGKAQFRNGAQVVDPRSTKGKILIVRDGANQATAKEIQSALASAGISHLVYEIPNKDLEAFMTDLTRGVLQPGYRLQRMPIASEDGLQREALVMMARVKEGSTVQYDMFPVGVTLTRNGDSVTVEIGRTFHTNETRVRRGIPPPDLTVDKEFADLYKITGFDSRLFSMKTKLSEIGSLDETDGLVSGVNGVAATAQAVWDNIAHHHMVYGKAGTRGFGIRFLATGPEITIPPEVRQRMSAIGMTEEDMLNGYHGGEESPSVFARMIRATNRFADTPGVDDTYVNVDLKPTTYTTESGARLPRKWALHSRATGDTTLMRADYENQEALQFYFKYNGSVDRIGVSSTHDIPMILMHQRGTAPAVFVRSAESPHFTWYLQSGNTADEAKDLVIVTDHAFVLPSGNPGDDVLKGALPTEVVNAIDLGFKLRGAVGPFGQGNMGEAVASHIKRQAIGRWPSDAKPILDAAGLWTLRQMAAARGMMMRVTAEGIEFVRPGLATATGEWAQPIIRLAKTVGEIRDILSGGEADAFLDTHQLNELSPLVHRLAAAAQEATPHVDPANPQADTHATGLQAYLKSWNDKMLTFATKWNYLLGNMHRLTGILEEKTGLPIWRLYQRAHEGWQAYEAERVSRIKIVASIIGDMDDEEQRLITHWLDMGAFRTDLSDAWRARLVEFESRYAPALTPRVREKAEEIRKWFDTMYSEFEPGYGKDEVPAEIAYAPWLRHKAQGMAERSAEAGHVPGDKDSIDYVVGTPWFHHARMNQAWDPMYDDRIGSLMSKYLDTAVRHRHLRPISAEFVDTIRAIESMRNEYGGYEKVELAYAVRTLRHINNIVTGNYGPGTTNFYGGAYKFLSKITGNQRLAKFITENMVTYGISSGLGFRPGSAIRNLIYAPLPVFTLLGGRHLGVGMRAMVDFMRGNANPDFVRFVDKEKNTYLENWMADALDNFQRITVGRVPMSEKVPAEFMRRSLVLQEKTEVFNRGFSFFAGVSSGREVFAKYAGRELSERDIRLLLDETPLGVFHAAEQKYLLEALKANDEVAFVQRYANSVVRFTQFTYGPFESFRAANNKVGKLAFFFGSWTMNQAGMVGAFLRRAWTADGRITTVNRNSLKYVMRFSAGTIAGYEALKMAGLDPDSTFAFTPTGYAGSPYMQTGIDLVDWFRTTGHRKEMARNQFYTRLSQVFTPGGAVMSDVIKGIDDINEGDYWHSAGHVVFGTTPVEESKLAEKGKFTHWAPTAPKRVLHGLGFINKPKMYDRKRDSLADNFEAARKKLPKKTEN